ncbi:MAG: twin-arginine translocase TatA/TatE family subunit [Ignavibacteriae bacterium HGW-Ignavibacteriae-1]|jgi:sec-independent protein translocase protein TatA|nr:MAG: twin-arginine translocase TatA/TatE family subunit [Ignavibacteriae bacterium HGW-Ignavibacteriae-1]
MFDVGGGELMLIILAVLILFGPKKLPEFAQMIKRGVNEMKNAQRQFSEQVTEISREVQKPVNTIKNAIENEVKEPPKQVIKEDYINKN